MKEIDSRELKKIKEKSKSPLCFEIAKKMREFINENEITDKNFSEKCGIAASSMSSYLNGETELKAETILKIADAMGVSTDYLLGKSKFKNSNEIDISINKEMGLSEIAINNLKTINTYFPQLKKTINLILENELCFAQEIEIEKELVELDIVSNMTEEEKENKRINLEKKLSDYSKIRVKNKPTYIISRLSDYFNSNIEKSNNIYIVKDNIYQENPTNDDLEKQYLSSSAKKITIENKLVDNVLLDDVKISLINTKQNIYGEK